MPYFLHSVPGVTYFSTCKAFDSTATSSTRPIGLNNLNVICIRAGLKGTMVWGVCEQLWLRDCMED